MSSALKTSVAAFALVFIPVVCTAATYTPIPAGFDFPADGAKLLAQVKTDDQAALRTHAWMVFAGLTQPARPAEADSEAVWETWYSNAEVFGLGPALQGKRPLQRIFVVPRQFKAKGPGLEAIGASALSFTLFNQPLRDHTRNNKLQMTATLAALDAGWTPQTNVADRKIKDYPIDAVSVKVVWKLVKRTGLTTLPVWDTKAPVAVAPAQPESQWDRVVLIDPTRSKIPANETRDVNSFGKLFKGARVVPLNAFYHFKLSSTQAQQANASGAVSGAATGDYVAVVAMHNTTKEIPDWVWATFWWHDKPNAGRFSENRPDAKALTGVWRNYLMSAAYSMDSPKEADGTPPTVFNPYLEARFANGANSNCMTCHRQAVWSKNDNQPNFLPVTRGSPMPDDPRFKNGTASDFLWSLLYEGNQPQP